MAKTELSILLVNNQEIRQLNKKFLGHDYATDVLSFPQEGDQLLGDVVISVERAALQAKELKHSQEKELNTLLIHGILHLLGYLDDNQQNKAKMEQETIRILALLEK